MQTFFAGLNGSNCHLSGQTIISLSVTEDADADYDTASATCLAPGGPFAKGATVETVEGGVSTGYWEVEDPVTSRSGEKTWRRRAGAAGYSHLPLVSYKLRRKGYMKARSTLSKAVVGANNYPPKFCTMAHFDAIEADLQHQLQPPPTGLGTIDIWEYIKQRGAWHVVYDAEYIVAQIARWVGLSISSSVRLEACADEYIPVDKPAISAIREIAAWSGAAVLLERSGNLRIFNWQEEFGRGGAHPNLRAVLEEETHSALTPVNQVTVVGQTYAPDSTRACYGNKLWPLEVTENLPRVAGEGIVAERIEIRDYTITPNLAKAVAQERLSRAYLEANTVSWRGPAEGCQAVRPLANHVLSVNRTLDWNGNAYRYEIQVTAAAGAVPFAGDTSSVGRWW